MATERELKFSSPDGQVPALEELNAALAQLGCSATDLGSVTQVDLYYDDRAGTLQGAGLALRVRSAAGRRLATLKSRGSVLQGVHERDEFEQALAEEAPPPWPEGIAAKAPGVDLGRLAPRMIITTLRRRFNVQRAGAPVAELAFDEVTCRPAAEVLLEYSIDEARFDEVELEALTGTAGGPISGAELTAIGAALQELMPLYPSDISKLERASSLLAPFAE